MAGQGESRLMTALRLERLLTAADAVLELRTRGGKVDAGAPEFSALVEAVEFAKQRDASRRRRARQGGA